MERARIILLIFLFSLAIFLFKASFKTPYQQFSEQSYSFLNGKLDISPQSHDTVVIDGKHYWPLGLFPSALLMPFQTTFGMDFNQSIMQIILTILLIFLLYRLCRLKKFSINNSFYLIFAFLLGSPIAGLIIDPRSWHFAQIVTVTLLIALLLELEKKRRVLLMGILLGAIIATRLTAAFIIFPIIYWIGFKKFDLRSFSRLVIFLLPVLLSILLLTWFNYVRFGNPLDNGYLEANVGPTMDAIRRLGLFSFVHIPSNIYYYFLTSVEPITQNTHLIFPFFKFNPWGLSFFIVAPFFVFAFKSLKTKDLYIRLLWVTCGLTLFTLLCYYAPGWYQFGPRYIADFFPILFLLTLYGLEKSNLSSWQKNIICLSSLVNIYLLISPMLIR